MTNLKCYGCGKYGHKASDCFANQDAGRRTSRRPRPVERAAFHFACHCGNEFSGVVNRRNGSSPCYVCNAQRVLPLYELHRELQHRRSSNVHNCNLCHGNGHCVLFT